jgi:hypothetical protein
MPLTQGLQKPQNKGREKLENDHLGIKAEETGRIHGNKAANMKPHERTGLTRLSYT